MNPRLCGVLALFGPMALFTPLVSAAEPLVAPLTETVGAGTIDWTAMELNVTAHSNRTVGAWKDRRVQEQDALDRLGLLLQDAAKRVRVLPGIQAQDLLGPDEAIQGPEIARQLDDALSTWRVRETRYISNGGVELDGVLDLQRWLRPAFLTLAKGQPRPPIPDGATGVLMDARDVDFQPCVSPEIRTDDGRILFGAPRMHSEAIRVQTTVVYVTDPADPHASDRAGNQPLFLTAAAAEQGCLLRLSSADSQRLGNNPGLIGLAATGKVAIVVRP